MPQPVTGAAVYILHLPSTREMARAELFRHLGPLRASGGIVLVLTTRLLPEPGSLPDPRVEAVARARDLSMLQLANDSEMEMTELIQIVESVADEVGKLVLANELRSYDGLILALALKHLHHAC
jgi:predicted nucleic acid-binding protein